ncbi:FUN14 family [Fragilaria crotonensis]|nr:FUN14 family [Fragilaria crotonensis]
MVENNKPEDALETALEKLKPILSKLSFGMFAGYTSGYATKKIGKIAAVLVGVSFIFLQSLAAAGYIEIDWLKVQDTAVKKMDTDGDGKLSVEDLKGVLAPIPNNFDQ